MDAPRDAAPPLSPGAKEDAMTLTRRSFNHALLATAAIGVAPAFAQALKSLKITAPAGPGGGYDQLARSTQEVLVGEKLAASVQVINVPGAGGTVGLAGFANAEGARSGAPRRRPRPRRRDLHQQGPGRPRPGDAARAPAGRVPAALRGRELADQDRQRPRRQV